MGAAIAAAAFALAGCATTDKDDLAAYVDQLHSDAVEGILVADQAARGKLPAPFTWIESAQLEHHAGELLDHLSGGAMTGHGLEARLQRADEIAHQLKVAFGELHRKANRPAEIFTVQRSLAEQAAAAKSLFEELQ